MRWILTIVCLAIFFAGLYLYSLAFQNDLGVGSLMLFIGGILLNSLAFFLPWQVIGNSRK